jgi:Tol biopolymer transport system component/DNA-binding winged helix-turn-helix (wHTH) protein
MNNVIAMPVHTSAERFWSRSRADVPPMFGVSAGSILAGTLMTSFQVGDWRVYPSLNRMSRGADDVRIEPKVMRVLECLAEKPGEVVSRDELVERIWPRVFVTDDVLHRTIRELRRAFGDDTANPKYIETIRKRGYRLIAPVGPVQRETVAPVEPAETVARGVSASDRRFRARAAIAALAVAVGAATYFLVWRGAPVAPNATGIRFVALTSAPGNESDPSPSADGKHLAFSMRERPGGLGQSDIYMADGPGSTPVRVTTNPADDMLPAWSPDGRTIAFARIDGRTCDVILLSVAGRRERKLTACGNPDEPHVAWSPDGEWLVESFAPGPDPHRGWQIARVSTTTGVREPLTLSTPGTLGDHSPSVSPDGRRIAFVRAINGAIGDIHLIPFRGGAAGALTRVTSDNQDIIGLDWTPDGRSLVFASDRAGGYSIFRVPVDGGVAQVVAGGSAKLKHPSVARGSGQIVYESWAYEINLWVAPASSGRSEEGDGLAAMRPVVRSSDLWNHSPDLTADGKQLAFVSTRSGEPQLWVANPDGSSPRQISTFTRAALRQPRWSADGARLLISASVLGQPDLYAIDAASGATTRLTDDADDEIAPSWSRDGASVLFGARRSGTWQVVRLTAADRTRTQVTTDGGYAASESPDGRSVLFTRLDAAGLWTLPMAGGTARLLVPGIRAAETTNWRVTPNGIYYIGVTDDQPVIRRAPLSGGNGEDVASIANYAWPGFAITGDGTGIVFARWDRRESNIMAIETRP